MAIIIFIILTVGLVIGIVWLIKCYLLKRRIIREFKTCNVVVTGKKGRGKDLLFQEVINKRHDYYYSNINYGGKYQPVQVKEISIAPNSFKNLITGDIIQIERKFMEETDFYISDSGVILPSDYDSYLVKTYDGLPPFYALSRHLYKSNVHCNVQNFGRLWKKIREQGDYFITCRGVKKIPFYLLIKVTCYDRWQSCEGDIRKIKTRFFNKFSKAETNVYNASNGEILEGTIIVRKRGIKYDTRAFEKKILKGPRIYKPNKWKERLKAIKSKFKRGSK